MLLLDPTETAITRADTLKDKGKNPRHWKVVGKHPAHKENWIIRSGPTSRIIFPLDYKDYHIVLAN